MTNDNEIPHGDQLMHASLALLAALKRPYALSDAQAITLINTYGAAITDHYGALIADSGKDAHCADDRDKILAISDALYGQGTKLADIAMRARERAQGQPGTNED